MFRLRSPLPGLLLLDPTAQLDADLVDHARGVFILTQAETLTIFANPRQITQFLQLQVALL